MEGIIGGKPALLVHFSGLHQWFYGWFELNNTEPLCGERAGGLAPPLYIHSTTEGSIQGRLREGSPETEWEQRVTQLFRSQVLSHLRSILPDRNFVVRDAQTLG